MFYVWDIDGNRNTLAPHARGRPGRQVEKVSATTSTAAYASSDVHPSNSETPSSTYAKSKQMRKESRSREPAILAKQIMSSPVVTLKSTTDVDAARAVFQKHRFRHIPVVAERGSVIGIISDRDLLQHAADTSQDKQDVRSIMTAEVITAQPMTEIRLIARVFFEQRIGGMPIVDDQGTPLGMVTRSDILRTVTNNAPLELWI